LAFSTKLEGLVVIHSQEEFIYFSLLFTRDKDDELFNRIWLKNERGFEVLCDGSNILGALYTIVGAPLLLLS
jgi:hypothetical protein